jgi:hypothetical protein
MTVPGKRDEAERLVGALEAAISEGRSGESNARKILRSLLSFKAGADSQIKSLGEAVEVLGESANPMDALEAATLVRCLSLQGFWPVADLSQAERAAVNIVQCALPDLAEKCELATKRQTFEKVNAIRMIHPRTEEILRQLTVVQPDLDSILAARHMLTKVLNDRLVRAYCTSFRLTEIRSGFDTINTKLAKLSKEPSSLAADIMDCATAVQEQISFCQTHLNFVTHGYYLPYLRIVEGALDKFFQTVRGRFQAAITPRLTESGQLQKRYPFREMGRRIRLAIPLRNSGPGTAMNVSARIEADCDKILFESEELLLGNIAPGDFSAVYEAEVMATSESVDLLLSITWTDAGQSNHKLEFEATGTAQRSDIDWQAQEYLRPYSMEVAKGSTFVGRADKVRMLANKMIRTPMESFYVTGQKRVGKTSLAIAAADSAEDIAGNAKILYKYLLWGEIAHADSIASLRELGERIAEFIIVSLPRDIELPTLNFSGSIAGLVRLAEIAAGASPGKKYVVIIDEFDEIHPDLYQHGNLAETFFANIRALTARDNFSIVLVGGENMPFVMDRQGQKLNKLVRVPLDYFSRDLEWEDFKLLVTKPSEGVLEWHEEAVSEVFNATNGNPFFAKNVCAAIFENCVGERDSDVTQQEVRTAIQSKVPTFDSNAFAHLWQDGIHKSVAEREPEILRRCRTLVLISRVARRNLPITLDNLLAQKHGIEISNLDVVSALNSFVSRTVLKESQGQYSFVLPIFRSWLVEVGGSRLIADTLSEELAQQVRTAEDQAFVQSNEVTELARTWPTYQGREITADDIRAWYEQIEGHQQQRLLFRLLQSVRFYGEAEVREKLQALHGQIRPMLPEFIIRKRTDRRQDVIITYADGEGKSGQFYGSRYADLNRIATSCVVSPAGFRDLVQQRLSNDAPTTAILFMDDLIATGRSFVRNLSAFVDRHEDILRALNLPVNAMALAVTSQGEAHVREAMCKFDWLNFDLRYIDLVGPQDVAFAAEPGIWSNLEERDRAKALCEDLGACIYPHNPLGFGSHGLLLVFPQNCPNNSLPILHSPSTSSANRLWRPLFPRISR